MLGEPSARSSRIPLDTLVERLRDPAFAARHRRRLSFRETSQHVDPLMLAAAGSDSLYVKAWRHHAAGCPECANLFEYFGITTSS